MKDKYLAEDLFQDLFIRIISKLNEGKYKDEGKFLPWALRIAHNLCLDHFRKIKQTTIIKVANDVDIFERFNLSEDGADQCLMKEQSHEIVRKMIAMLPEEQKEMVVLRHYAGLSFKEIASLTNTTVNTALGRMRYALINLRKMMEEKQIAL